MSLRDLTDSARMENRHVSGNPPLQWHPGHASQHHNPGYWNNCHEMCKALSSRARARCMASSYICQDMCIAYLHTPCSVAISRRCLQRFCVQDCSNVPLCLDESCAGFQHLQRFFDLYPPWSSSLDEVAAASHSVDRVLGFQWH